MSLEKSIAQKLGQKFGERSFELVNESSSHRLNPTGETHFYIRVVSDQFQGKKTIERHRMIQEMLSEERAGGLHAIRLKTLTPSEWESSQEQSQAPNCLGGGLVDSRSTRRSGV